MFKTFRGRRRGLPRLDVDAGLGGRQEARPGHIRAASYHRVGEDLARRLQAGGGADQRRPALPDGSRGRGRRADQRRRRPDPSCAASPGPARTI
ncbi:hypothetical protein ACRAWD_03030 [Caulobacter segnis]